MTIIKCDYCGIEMSKYSSPVDRTACGQTRKKITYVVPDADMCESCARKITLAIECAVERIEEE